MVLASCAQAADPSPADLEFFEAKVRPILATSCFGCHSTKAMRLEANLLLDSQAGALKGGDTGPALVAGQPDDSLLVQAIRYDDVALQMPPDGKLPADQVATLTEWVRRGAPWPKSEAATGTAAGPPPFDLEKRKREHWCWQPIRSSHPPRVHDSAWPANEIDRYLLAKLEAAKLHPAPDADRGTLLRRLSFDLIGLPPTPEELQAFLADDSPRAYERAVDRLLAAPRYGERWARHWLDLVRYAETRGHEFDYEIPGAHQYRDYVIRALNVDVPYDQFIREHVAGDLLREPRRNPEQSFNESLLGTGFWFLGEATHSPVDCRKDETDRFDNSVDVFAKTFLGLTVACARCHDHKFDAIGTKDYYALFGFLRSSHFRLAGFDVEEQNRAIAECIWKLDRRHRPAVERALAAAYAEPLEQVADYLLAAREALQAAVIGRKELPKELTRKSLGIDDEKLSAIATVFGLDPKQLGGWIDVLVKAAGAPSDPLHAWAKLAVDPATADVGKWKSSLAQLRGPRASPKAIRVEDIVIDYSTLAPADWRQDGVMFGSGPIRPGDWQPSGDPRRPVARVFTRASAQKDPVWDGLRLADGEENEPGRMSGCVRPGQTLYTPSFTISAGFIYYLVRGAGHVYAEVDAHRVNNGPLHGAMLLDFDTEGSFRWIRQKLDAYRGHRAHLELTARAGADLAVVMIVQGSEPPADPRRGNTLLSQLFAGNPQPTELADGYQRLLIEALAAWGRDESADRGLTADRAELVAWLVDHNDLLVDTASLDEVSQRATPWFDERAKLATQIHRTMHVAPVMTDTTGDDEHVLIRGNSASPGDVVPRRFLEALAGPDQPLITHGSGRLELAERLLDESNPLTARVIVNRLWHHLFGRGIVASTDNFGVLGERPTHPELLDWLAARMVRDGWSRKKMIKLIVMSRAYRMESRPHDTSAEQADPKNLLWHRMPVRRLESEAIRDGLLAVAGSLVSEGGGPSVPVHLTEFLQGRGRPKTSGPLDGAGRRSIYLAVRRNFLSPLMLAFDTPSPFSTVGKRNVSNVPAQALILMNDPLVREQAERWAKRLCQHESQVEPRLEAMYLAALSRRPTDTERAAALAFLADQGAEYRLTSEQARDDVRVWADLCHTLVNTKEFIFLY